MHMTDALTKATCSAFNLSIVCQTCDISIASAMLYQSSYRNRTVYADIEIGADSVARYCYTW